MPEIKFNIGATVDVASSKELSDGLSGLQGHIEKHSYRGEAKPVRKPFTISTQYSGVTFGGSTVCIVTDATKTPAVGRFWILRSAFAYDGATPLAAGFAGINMALAIGNAVSPAPSHLRAWEFTGTPNATTFGTTALHVYPNETVYLVVNEATLGAGTDLSFNFEVDEYVSCEYEAQRL